MRGKIITNIYTYVGDIQENLSHGKGTYNFTNGDKYVGESKNDKIDGFGTYEFANKSKYTGFFTYGLFNGMGTYENNKIITKGTWRLDMKHGIFIKTYKEKFKTFAQKWESDELIESKEIQYTNPDLLYTTRENPKNSPKIKGIKFKGVEKKCIGCYQSTVSACMVRCGHVAMCYDCLNKCDCCPICRAPKSKILHLYIS